MKKLFFPIILVSFTTSFSCKNHYTYTTEASFPDSTGLPSDSLVFYFPPLSFSDTPKNFKLDSFVQNWYSSALYSFREPILSRSYLGHDIYRFLWLRSFHRPVVFSVHRRCDKILLTTKILNHQPNFDDERIGGITPEYRHEYLDEGFSIDKKDSTVMFRKADRKAVIVYNETKELSVTQLQTFENLLTKSSFWEIPPTKESDAMDGARWIIEAHTINNYKFVDRQSGDEIKQAGLFIIDLSGIKEEIY